MSDNIYWFLSVKFYIMLRNKYGKDQLYLRLIQKEKNDYLAKQSNKIIKKFGDNSKETIK